MDDLVPIIALLIPIVAIWTSHQRKMLQMRLEQGAQVDAGLRGALDELRNDVRSLKDTTMQYDLSFDSALQRMEGRVEQLERRVTDIQNEQQVNRLGNAR